MTEEELESLAAERIPIMYLKFFKGENITEVKDLKFQELERKNIDSYVYVSVKVSYKCESNNREVDMSDYYILNLVNNYDEMLVSKILFPRENSNILKYYTNSTDNKKSIKGFFYCLCRGYRTK